MSEHREQSWRASNQAFLVGDGTGQDRGRLEVREFVAYTGT